MAVCRYSRPRAAPVLEYKKITSAKNKYAIRSTEVVTGFWNEVRALNRVNTVLPSTIEGVGPKGIKNSFPAK